MNISQTKLHDAVVIEPTVYGDERGFFMETYRHSLFAERVTELPFVQDNHSKSKQGALRGLHYQIKQTQGKLIRVISGCVYDVIVDLRKSSTTFSQWQGFWLSSENKRQLWVPPGFAHGFYVAGPDTEFIYKCTDYYAPEHERILLWSDPELAIDWPLLNGKEPLLSEKDQRGLAFSETEKFD